MIANMNEKGRQTKLLAAIAIIAMVVCVFAAVMPSEDVNAEDSTDPVVSGTSATVYDDTGLKALIEGINSGSGEYASITTINLGSESFGSTTDYTKYVIQKNVTIQPADGVTPTVYGGFVIYNVDDVVIKGIEICPDGEGNTMKTGIVVYASGITITNCTFTLDINDVLANGIMIYPKAPATEGNYNYNITGNKFSGFINMNASDYGSTAIGFAANCALTFGTGGYFTDISGAETITSATIDDATLQSIEIDLATENQYTNCFYIVGYDDWNGNGTNVGGTYVPGKIDANVVTSGSLAENYTNIIVPGQSITVSDDITVAGNLIVQGTLTVADGKKLTADNLQIDPDGVVNVYGTLAGTSIENNGTVRMLSDKAVIPTMAGNGSVDTSAVSSEATLSGDLKTSTTFTEQQIVTVTNNLTLIDGTVLEIKGQLIIPEGVTVTIQEGAQLIINGQAATVQNNGTVVIQSAGPNNAGAGLDIMGGVFTNNGTIDAQYLPENSATGADATVISIAGAIVNNGTVDIGVDSGITVTGTFDNKSGAQLNVNGTIVAAKNSNGKAVITNAGSVSINGVVSGNSVYIDLVANGASVDIVSVTSTVYVTDSGFKSSTKTPFANESETNTVGVYAGSAFTAGGITVVSTTYTADKNDDGKTETYKALDVAGTFTVASTADTADSTSSTFRLAGQIIVSEELNVGAGATLGIGLTGIETDIQVSGTMNITANQAATATDSSKPFRITTTGTSADMYVTGEVVSLSNLTVDTPYKIGMNAASYTEVVSGITTYHYTTLPVAIGSGAKVIDTYGVITVSEDVTIANGVTVRQQGGEIGISTDVTVTIEDGGKLTQNNGAKIDVDGSLYLVNSRTGISGQNTTEGSESILSQVMSSNGTDALYTNLVDAMETAESGETITLYSKPVALNNTSFTIKEGVTVDTDGKDFDVMGTNLVINGTLYINGATSTYDVGSYKVSDSYSAPSTVTLNGYLKFNESVSYSDTDLRFPAGAYYSITQNGIPYYYITTVSNAAAVINDAEDNTVTIDGKLAMGTVTFTGTETEQAIVQIASTATITSGNVTLNLSQLNIEAGAEFTGTVTDGTGNVDVKIADPENGTASAAPSFEVTANNGLTVSGNGYGAEMTFSGEVAVNDLVSISVMNVEGTVTIDGNSTSVSKTLNITGTLNVAGGVLTATGADTFVTGALNTAVASAESSDNGTANLGDMYVGIGMEKDKLVDGAAGTVYGNVSASVSYVSADSNVPENMINADGMNSTQFFVNEDLWMTAYAREGNISVPNAPVTDADFIGWADKDGAVKYYAEGKTTDSSAGKASEIPITAYSDLYADINYNVYTVSIRTDGGIGSVAIDGNLMTNNGGNTFTMSGLTAGEHKVTYTLKNGFQGEAVLSSSDLAVSGNTFTLTGDFDTTYVLNLAGTEPADQTIVIDGGNNGGSDGLSLTDYLLIILVILIVIMAIIVASRMMRS